MDPSRGFPLITLIQADGRNDLEKMVNSGDAQDPFRARHNNAFSKTTNPAARYYDGTPSNIDINTISDSGAVMTFRIGDLRIAKDPLSPTPTAASIQTNRLSYDLKTSPSGAITFTLPAAAQVTIKAYNAKGKQIKTLVDGMRNSGTHSINPNMIGQGLYIIRMKSGKYSKDVKIRCLR
jgi:hypothetical protein